MDAQSYKKPKPDSNLVDSFSPEILAFDIVFNNGQFCQQLEKAADKFNPGDCSRCILCIFQIYFAILFKFRRSDKEFHDLKLHAIVLDLYQSIVRLNEIVTRCSDDRLLSDHCLVCLKCIPKYLIEIEDLIQNIYEDWTPPKEFGKVAIAVYENFTFRAYHCDKCKHNYMWFPYLLSRNRNMCHNEERF